jgi:hypothetical protein
MVDKDFVGDEELQEYLDIQRMDRLYNLEGRYNLVYDL